VQLGEQQFVQPLPHSGLLPGAKPPPSRHAAAKAELLRQMLPADPGVQHEQDPLQHLPVGERLAARIAETPLLTGSKGSIRSHSPSGTTHGFAASTSSRA